MPKHIAIIMDGNGRWATAKGLTRSNGHKEGAENIRRIAKAAWEHGVKYLTLYAFSTENWKRPKLEVNFLMRLIREYAENGMKRLMNNNIRLETIGRTEDLPFMARRALMKAIEATKNNDGLVLTIALSYGGRAEIVDAVNRIISDGKSCISEEDFRQYLYAPTHPDPDLLIRTGGEMRISNFLLWELSYSEFYVTDTFWPEFDADCLAKAIEAFRGRHRRFGDAPKA